MDKKYIQPIIRYNTKLLLRSRLLIIYIFCAIAFILYTQIRRQSGIIYTSADDALNFASFIPYMNLFFFSIFSTLPLIALATYSLCKGHKIDTLDAIYYRPISNSEYIWGIGLAFIGVFGGMALLSLLLIMPIHLFCSSTPFNIWLYLFYWFTMIIPSVVFLVGLSLFVVSKIKNQVFSFLLIFGYIFLSAFHTQNFQFGLLDPLGINLPNTFSDITGHPNIDSYLLQRGFYFFLGLGLIQLTVTFVNRIPNNLTRTKKIRIVIIYFVIGGIIGFSFLYLHHHRYMLRNEYRAIYNKYVTYPKVSQLSQNINYEQIGNNMRVGTKLLVQNQTEEQIKEIILYLNPRLKIRSISSNGKNLPFEREMQVILVREKLSVNDSLNIDIIYEGQVDENLCYLDVPDKTTMQTTDMMYFASRHGKHYTYMKKDFTLLIPEVLWYPTTVPPVNPRAIYDIPKNFSKYTLEVSLQGNNKAISQGKRIFDGNKTIFTTQYPLHGISLCIGDYNTQQIIVDSIIYEFNILKRHAHLFNDICQDQGLSFSEVIRNAKEGVEQTLGSPYPFNRFTVIETPVNFASYFRNQRGGSEFVQPELLFFPERGFSSSISLNKGSTENKVGEIKSFLLTEDKIKPIFSWKKIFGVNLSQKVILVNTEVENYKNNYLITSKLINHTLYIQSHEYPFIDVLVNLILQDNNETRKDMRRQLPPKIEYQATNYLSSKSLKDALQDENLSPAILNAILLLKSREFVDILDTEEIPLKEFLVFLNSFVTKYRFHLIDIHTLNEEFKMKFNKDILRLLPSWYTCNQLPVYLINHNPIIRVNSVNPDQYQIRAEFSIFNDSDIDGIINLQTYSQLAGGAMARMQALIEGRREFTINYKAYRIGAKSGKRFVLVLDNVQGINLNTNLSRNLPNKTVLNSLGIFTSDTSQYIQDITKDSFLPDSNEIIVDNRDAGFRIIESYKKLSSLNQTHNNEWEKYENYNSSGFLLATDNWKEYISQSGYGSTIHSFLFKKAKSDNYSLAWSAYLHKAGIYEAFVFIPSDVPCNSTGEFNKTQRYKILPNGEKEQIVDIDIERQDEWHSLGIFECIPGESTIYLNEVGEENQILVADAIKWVYKNPKTN